MSKADSARTVHFCSPFTAKKSAHFVCFIWFIKPQSSPGQPLPTKCLWSWTLRAVFIDCTSDVSNNADELGFGVNCRGPQVSGANWLWCQRQTNQPRAQRLSSLFGQEKCCDWHLSPFTSVLQKQSMIQFKSHHAIWDTKSIAACTVSIATKQQKWTSMTTHAMLFHFEAKTEAKTMHMSSVKSILNLINRHPRSMKWSSTFVKKTNCCEMKSHIAWFVDKKAACPWCKLNCLHLRNVMSVSPLWHLTGSAEVFPNYASWSNSFHFLKICQWCLTFLLALMTAEFSDEKNWSMNNLSHKLSQSHFNFLMHVKFINPKPWHPWVCIWQQFLSFCVIFKMFSKWHWFLMPNKFLEDFPSDHTECQLNDHFAWCKMQKHMWLGRPWPTNHVRWCVSYLPIVFVSIDWTDRPIHEFL